MLYFFFYKKIDTDFFYIVISVKHIHLNVYYHQARNDRENHNIASGRTKKSQGIIQKKEWMAALLMVKSASYGWRDV